MGLYEDLIAACDFLTEADFNSPNQTVWLQNDSDGEGSFIAKWNRPEPLPSPFKVGKD